MRAGAFLIVAAVILLFFAVSTGSEAEKTRVIVYFKEPPSDAKISPFALHSASISTAGNLGQIKAFESYGMEVTRDLPALNGFVAEVTPAYYDALKANPNVEVYKNIPLFLTLDQTANLVNASLTWNLIHNATNITGDGVTVCVIDSGINYSHPDLGGCTQTEFLNGECDKVRSGYDYWNDEQDIMDHQGHGTHVSGIIASTNAVYRGMAPGARLVGVQACDDSSSSCDADMVVSGIDWCISNSSQYNISIISISIGTAGVYTSWCDNDGGVGLFRRPIDEATAKNITVVVSSGNNGISPGVGSKTGISAPACIFNATAVGSTTKSDGFAASGNRNNITDLVAPGDSIVSLDTSGTTTAKSGTSMAAPHVSGVLALLRQYLRVSQNVTLTNTSFLVNSINTTGVVLNDSGGSNLNFSRILVYNAIINLDSAGADFTFVAPTPADSTTTTNNGSIFINVTASEIIKNTTLEWSNGTSKNYSMNGSGLNWHINFSTPVLGDVTYRVFANDTAENIAFSTTRNLLIQSPAPNITVISPVSAANISGSLLVNASVNTTGSVVRVNITLFNNTHNVTLPLLMNLTIGSLGSGYWNATLNSADFPDGKYNVSINSSDATGNSGISPNVSITIDNSASNASVAAANFTALNGSNVINASVNDSASGIFNVTFRIINPITNSSWLPATMNSGTIAKGYWNASFNFSALPEGDYNITINSTDFAGNSQLVNISQVSVNGTFVAVTSCSSLSSSNRTYKLLNNLSSDGTCIEITASNITLSCEGNAIYYGAAASGYGIDVQSVNSTAIKNCAIIKNGTTGSNNYGIHLSRNTNATAIINATIITNGTSSNYGILVNNSRYTNVSGISITARGNESFNFGIYLLADSQYNNITSVIVTANGTSGNYGIFLEKSSNNMVARSSISSLGNESNNYAVFLTNASANNTLLLNNLTTNASDSNHGIRINNSNGNNITLNRITTATNSSHGILIENSNASIIATNTITTFGNFSFAVSIQATMYGNSTNNSVYNNYFNTTARAVNITGNAINNFSVAVSSGINILGESTSIGGNYYDNSTPGGQQAFSLSCTDANRNGICDTSLAHAANSTDFAPLRIQPPAPPAPSSSSSSSSGGGGGGGGSAVSVSGTTSQSRVWDKIEPGTTTEFKVTSEKIPFSSITFELSEAAESVELTVSKRLVKPDDVAVDYAGVVSSYIVVSEINLKESAVSSAEIAFSVEKEWVFNNSALSSDVVLARYSAGSWHDLPTELVSSTALSYNYRAISPGLSVFAIAVKPKPEAPKAGNGKLETSAAKLDNATGNSNLTVAVGVGEIPYVKEKRGISASALLISAFSLLAAFAVFVMRKRRGRHNARHK